MKIITNGIIPQKCDATTGLLQIKILEARHISSLKPQKETFNKPHVRVELYGEFEEDGKVWNTNEKGLEDEELNGFHPVWNTTFGPHLVSNKDLAFLDFKLTEVTKSNQYRNLIISFPPGQSYW